MTDKNIKVRTVDMHRIGDQIVITNSKSGVRVISAQTVIKNLGPIGNLIEDGEVYQIEIAS